MNSLTVVILAAACVGAMCDRHSEWLDNAKECSARHNVTIDELWKALRGEIDPSEVTPQQKCMFLCMSQKEGLIKDGVLQTEFMAEKLANAPNKNEIINAMAICKDLTGTDNCDTAYQVMTCLAKNGDSRVLNHF